MNVATVFPLANADTAPYWEGCARGELLFQYCSACAKAQFFPRRYCVHCSSSQLEWRRSCGRGAVYSHTTVFRAPTAAFKSMVPYVIALVDMDEGFRLMVNIIEAPPEGVAIGTRVEITFVTGEMGTLPRGKVV